MTRASFSMAEAVKAEMKGLYFKKPSQYKLCFILFFSFIAVGWDSTHIGHNWRKSQAKNLGKSEK